MPDDYRETLRDRRKDRVEGHITLGNKVLQPILGLECRAVEDAYRVAVFRVPSEIVEVRTAFCEPDLEHVARLGPPCLLSPHAHPLVELFSQHAQPGTSIPRTFARGTCARRSLT
jgi:hypothetical protein